MMKAKKWIALFLTAAMAAGLTACGSTGSSASDTEKTQAADTQKADTESASAETETGSTGFTPALDTDLTATINVYGSWGNFEALDQAAADFQTYYPNVEVVYSQFSDEHSDLANKCATGLDIDIFLITWWNPEYTASEGLQMDLENVKTYAENYADAGIDLTNLDAELLKSGQVDGEQLLIPLYTASCGYIVNLDILDANGIEVPTTYAELQTCLAQLEEAGYDEPLYVNSGHLAKSYMGDYMDRILAGEDRETALKNCLADAQALYDTGYLNMEGDTLDDNYEALLLRFFEGDVPMISASNATYSGAAKREAKSDAFTENPFSYAYIPATFDESKASYTLQVGSMYMGIYKDSEQLDLDNEFVRFLLTDETMLTLEQIKHMSTANVNNGTSEFPYQTTDKTTYCAAATDGISVMDEQVFSDCVAAYTIGGDTADALQVFADFADTP